MPRRFRATSLRVERNVGIHESVAAITASVTGGAEVLADGCSVVREISVMPSALADIRLATTTAARSSRSDSPSWPRESWCYALVKIVL